MKRRMRMALGVGLVVWAGMAGRGDAAAVNAYFEGFENYADTAALATAWPDDASDNGVQTLGKLAVAGAFQGTNCLQLAYTANDNPSGVFMDRLVFTFTSDQNWSGFTTFTFFFRGTAGNSRDQIYFELKDQFGGTLGSASLPNATTATVWQLATIDISGYGNIANGTSLANVRKVVIGVNAGTDSGVGTVYFDNIGGSTGSIPTLSEWGVIILLVALLLLGAGRLAQNSMPLPTAAALALICTIIT
jgi:hypothetical protein